MSDDLKEAYAELAEASIERGRIARQQLINARKEAAARHRWLLAKDKVWELESSITIETNKKLWNSGNGIQPTTQSETVPKALRHVPVHFATDNETHLLKITK